LTARIRVEHHSHYEYVDLVDSSFNEARITPATTTSQLVLDSRVEVSSARVTQRYVDYWGTIVHVFETDEPHRQLTVIGRSVVETSGPAPPADHVDWAVLDRPEVKDQFAEFLAPTTQVPLDPRLAERALVLRRSYRAAEARLAAIDWTRSQLRYVPGTTGVHTSAVEAWDGREGVCQDFAHLTLAVMRAMGVPSRYCSGYLHPDGSAGLGQSVDGQSHAWVEAWTGTWEALDPTIGKPAGEHHVLIARGRDYSDVPPIKGIFHGGPTASLDVSVRLTRLA
jgi:transglutaminase-like putative cysteine protease